MMGFYFAPPRSQGDPDNMLLQEKMFSEGVSGTGLQAGLSKLWA